MRTSLVGALLLSVFSCGVSETEMTGVEGDEQSTEQTGELGSSTRSYVVLRKDTRQCLVAGHGCGGWFVHDVNRATLNEQYVDWLDMSGSDVATDFQNDALTGADGEVVLYGKLGQMQRGVRPFIVTSAWRGMPGATVASTELFYSVGDSGIRCITTPCATLVATKLHSTTKKNVHDFDIARASKPMVDQNWLANRALAHGALVAGKFTKVGKEDVLDASQVFVKLEASHRSCGRPSLPFCGPGTVNTWARDDEGCTVSAGCARTGQTFCAQYVPTCAAGYTIGSYTASPSACTAYICDPTWLVEFE